MKTRALMDEEKEVWDLHGEFLKKYFLKPVLARENKDTAPSQTFGLS